MARKSSFTIRAQKRVRYTDAGDASEQAGDAEDGKENGMKVEDEVKERRKGMGSKDGTYAKFKREGGYKLPNRGSGRTNISSSRQK